MKEPCACKQFIDIYRRYTQYLSFVTWKKKGASLKICIVTNFLTKISVIFSLLYVLISILTGFSRSSILSSRLLNTDHRQKLHLLFQLFDASNPMYWTMHSSTGTKEFSNWWHTLNAQQSERLRELFEHEPLSQIIIMWYLSMRAVLHWRNYAITRTGKLI